MLTEFGKYLKKLRIDKDLTTKQMATSLSFGTTYLSGVETGKKNITNKMLNDIIRIYNFSEAEAIQLLVVASKCKNTQVIPLENLTPELRHLVGTFAYKIQNNSLSKEVVDKIQKILS